jgi:hypothetical protein
MYWLLHKKQPVLCQIRSKSNKRPSGELLLVPLMLAFLSFFPDLLNTVSKTLPSERHKGKKVDGFLPRSVLSADGTQCHISLLLGVCELTLQEKKLIPHFPPTNLLCCGYCSILTVRAA